MAFTGQAKAVRCKFCFSLTHISEECDWAPTARVATTLVTVAPPPTPTPQHWKNAGQICYSWNQSSDPHCPYPSCKYQHICLYCAKYPQAQHKIIKPSTAADVDHSRVSKDSSNHSPAQLPATTAVSTTASSHTPKEKYVGGYTKDCQHSNLVAIGYIR